MPPWSRPCWTRALCPAANSFPAWAIPGCGVFVVEDDNGLLFAAVAETNLAYAMALGRLGKMISYARYSADIFAENMLDDDD